MKALRDDFRGSAFGRPGGCRALLYDAARFGLDAVFIPLLIREGRGRARDLLGVKVFEDIGRTRVCYYFVWFRLGGLLTLARS